jgi:tripartite-type tricarboxylate transporter receptor subunit TctC
MFCRAACATIFALVGAGAVFAADTYPTRPIRILVNTGPGGLVDVTTRLVAQKLNEKFKQPVVVENRAGGDGLLGIRAVKGAPADGYTLLATAGTIAIQPAVKSYPGYDLAKDFTAIVPMIRSPFLLVVGRDQPDKSLADLVARARSAPGKMSYASAGVGTSTHIGAAVYLQQIGINLAHIPYKGNGPAMPDVIAGRVDMMFEAYGSGASKIKGGALRALGVTSASRLMGLPDVPTLAEQGATNFSFYTYLGLLAPAGTPQHVVKIVSEAVRDAMASNDLKMRLEEEGSEVMSMSPAEYQAYLEQDLHRMAKLAVELGVPKQ